MKDLFGSMGDPSLSIGRGMRSLLFGLMTMESGYEGHAQDRFDRSISPVRLERGMGGLS